jgi:phosphocarrier protein FPr/phosphocarrier protein
MILVAPLAGWSTPLDEAPDGVFAGRMLGDGLAIDPTGSTLYAPCDGELIAVPASKHAITLRAQSGAEILLHVGIDTVALAGEGFELHVRQGQRVRAGEPLVSFELDMLARRAVSVLTPVIVLEGSGFTIVGRSQGRELSVGDFLMELAPASATAEDPEAAEDGVTMARRVTVNLEHGIHARPAAVLARALKGRTAQVTLAARGREVSARSTVALMRLGVKRGDEVDIRASGPDAAAAVAAIESVLQSHEDASTGSAPRAEIRHTAADISPPPTPAVPSDSGAPAVLRDSSAPRSRSSAETGEPNTHRGVIASRGLAIGYTRKLTRPEVAVPEYGAGVSHESAELDRARATVADRLRKVASSGPQATREIIGAHLELLDDPELLAGARAAIANGRSAGYAWRQVIRSTVEALQALQDARMAERVDDLLDLEAQILGVLQGGDIASAWSELPPQAILVTKELLPSQLVALDASRLAGICMAAGGPTSHVAILAAAMGIPVLVAMGTELLSLADGTAVVLDAETGVLRVSPDRVQWTSAEGELERRRERRVAEQAAAQRECRTADGTRIEVFANVGSVPEAEAAVRNGAEGCGLLRTEFLFLERQSAPDEAEQTTQYQSIATALGGRPLTVRTLDIGGDKPIPYLPLPHEDNPALGLRGVRTSLWRPDLLRVQLRAVLAIRPEGQARILLPMITDAAEIRTIRNILEEERRNLNRSAPIELGVMIETPAAAVMSDRIAAEADFLSIGTNDLTQYALAMDRGHPELAARLDALHPAVLRLIARTASAGVSKGRTVSVCGGLASDPTAVPVLIGLGVHELSMVPSVIPQVKALIAGISLEACRELAREALELESAEAVRALALRALACARGEIAPVVSP